MISSDIGNVDYILHLAAGSHVDRSIDYPMEFVMDNVVGTCNVLEYAKNLDNLERFVYFSTDEVFGPAPNNVNYDENDRYNSTNPYSASKAGGEEFLSCFRKYIQSTSIYNSYDECIWTKTAYLPEKYIPMCIKKIRDGETISIHSDPTKQFLVQGTTYMQKMYLMPCFFFLKEISNLVQMKQEQSARNLI